MTGNVAFQAPIFWLDMDGNDVERTHMDAGPYVRLNIARRGPEELEVWHPIVALIDTGSTSSFVVPPILDLLAADQVGTKNMSGNWGAAKAAPFFGLMVRFSQCQQMVINVDAGQMTMPIGNTRAAAIVGLDLLRPFRVVLDNPPAPSFLEFVQST